MGFGKGNIRGCSKERWGPSGFFGKAQDVMCGGMCRGMCAHIRKDVIGGRNTYIRYYVYEGIYVYKCGERQRPSHLNGLGSCMFIALHTNHEMVMPLMFLNFPRSFCDNIPATNFACSHGGAAFRTKCLHVPMRGHSISKATMLCVVCLCFVFVLLLQLTPADLGMVVSDLSAILPALHA